METLKLKKLILTIAITVCICGYIAQEARAADYNCAASANGGAAAMNFYTYNINGYIRRHGLMGDPTAGISGIDVRITGGEYGLGVINP